MKERPILFSAPMVLAILEGCKTQTRRVINFDTVGNREQRRDCFASNGYDSVGERSIIRVPWNAESLKDLLVCPYGKVGDRMWVRAKATEASEAGGEQSAQRARRVTRSIGSKFASGCCSPANWHGLRASLTAMSSPATVRRWSNKLGTQFHHRWPRLCAAR